MKWKQNLAFYWHAIFDYGLYLLNWIQSFIYLQIIAIDALQYQFQVFSMAQVINQKKCVYVFLSFLFAQLALKAHDAYIFNFGLFLVEPGHFNVKNPNDNTLLVFFRLGCPALLEAKLSFKVKTVQNRTLAFATFLFELSSFQTCHFSGCLLLFSDQLIQYFYLFTMQIIVMQSFRIIELKR